MSTLDWLDRAACNGADPEQFFSDTPSVQRGVIDYYCDACPVREACRDKAIEQEGDTPKRQFGIRGGMTGPARYRLAVQLTKAAS